ncbi:MAG: hypothetical protein Q4C73_09650 [Eubacteriales bacterium]|nr:hypothetical protein [Eubacteriales bacterium]
MKQHIIRRLNNIKRMAAFSLVLAAAGSLAGGTEARAEETDTSFQRQGTYEDMERTEKKSGIGKLYLVFDSDLGIGADGRSVYVTPEADRASSEKYYVDDVQVLNDDMEDFNSSNPPELEVTLVSGDEDLWYFSSEGAGGFKLTLSEESKSRYEKVRFVSAERQDDDATLILRVQLLFDEDMTVRRTASPVISAGGAGSGGPGVSEKAGETSVSGWEPGKKGLAVWDKTDSAGYYQVQLLRDGADADIMRSVYWTSYDFSEKMTQPGAYSYRVRAVDAVTREKGEWILSGVLTVGA